MSWTVHRVLAYIESDEERFDAILTPPEGKTRWTVDDGSRRVGNQVETPVTPQEKITAIHSLAQDDKVAAAVTSVPDVRQTPEPDDGQGRQKRRELLLPLPALIVTTVVVGIVSWGVTRLTRRGGVIDAGHRADRHGLRRDESEEGRRVRRCGGAGMVPRQR